jgi:hypothetical protein
MDVSSHPCGASRWASEHPQSRFGRRHRVSAHGSGFARSNGTSPTAYSRTDAMALDIYESRLGDKRASEFFAIIFEAQFRGSRHRGPPGWPLQRSEPLPGTNAALAIGSAKPTPRTARPVLAHPPATAQLDRVPPTTEAKQSFVLTQCLPGHTVSLAKYR